MIQGEILQADMLVCGAGPSEMVAAVTAPQNHEENPTRFHRSNKRMKATVITLMVMLVVSNLVLPQDVARSSSPSSQLHLIDPGTPAGTTGAFSLYW